MDLISNLSLLLREKAYFSYYHVCVGVGTNASGVRFDEALGSAGVMPEWASAIPLQGSSILACFSEYFLAYGKRSEVFDLMEGHIVTVVEVTGIVVCGTAEIEDVVSLKHKVNVLEAYLLSLGISLSFVYKVADEMPASRVGRSKKNKMRTDIMLLGRGHQIGYRLVSVGDLIVLYLKL